MPELAFLVPGDPEQLTGGYLYDAQMVSGLRRHGWTVQLQGLPGCFPITDDAARQAADASLAAIPDGRLVIIDGLALGGLPEIVARHSDRLRLIALIHHPLADETGLSAAHRQTLEASERRALAQTRHVLVNSAFTASRMRDYGVDAARIAIAPPGVAQAPIAGPGADHPLRLLCVGSLIPRKGHDVLLQALSMLPKRNWFCDCAGSLQRDSAYGQHILAQTEALGLSDSIRYHGECSAGALNKLWRNSHALVLASRYEGYGMVLTEALAHGLPVIATRGGAIASTVPADAALLSPPEDATALADNLRRFTTQADLRRTVRDAALKARLNLSDWQAASDHFVAIINRLESTQP